MKINPNFTRKHIYWTVGIIGFLVIVNVGLALWLKSSFPTFINERNDTAYHFEFEKVDYSFWSRGLTVKEIKITPKEDPFKELKLDFTAHIKEIRISGVDFISLIRHKELNASTITINQPDIVYYKTENKDTIKTQSEFKNSIHISNFKIKEANFKLIDLDRKTVLSNVNNLSVELGGVDLSKETLEKKFPFTYNTYEIQCSDFFYQINPSQEIQSKGLRVNNDLFHFTDFKISMIDSTKSIKSLDPSSYRLLPQINAPEVRFHGLDWGFTKKDNFYFRATKLSLDSVDIFIPKTRNFISEKKRELGSLIPFYLAIDKIQIGNSKLEIEHSIRVENLDLEIDGVDNKTPRNLNIQKITIDQPLLTAYSNPKSKKKKTTSESFAFEDFIVLHEFETKNAEFQLIRHASSQNLMRVTGIDLDFKQIKVNPENFQNKIPFDYDFVKLKANSFAYHPNSIYDLNSKNLLFTNGHLSFTHLEMKPKVTRRQFVKSLKKEKDLFDIKVSKIDIKSIDFGFQGNDLFFKIPEININAADATIFRSKIPRDDSSKKPMYSKLLREIPFILEVKKVNLKNSKIVYEEETESSSGAGELEFSNFNAVISNLYSGYRKKSLPDVRVDITTDFMNESTLTTIWTFNSMSRSEKFNIKGSIHSFDAKKMTPFLKPYLHATADGNLNEVRFNFTGNDIRANGDFGIKYNDLKVKLYNPKTGKERKAVNVIGNLALKSNTRDEYKEIKIKTVERKQDRSFFNFLWLCVQQGLIESVLII